MALANGTTSPRSLPGFCLVGLALNLDLPDQSARRVSRACLFKFTIWCFFDGYNEVGGGVHKGRVVAKDGPHLGEQLGRPPVELGAPTLRVALELARPPLRPRPVRPPPPEEEEARARGYPPARQ